MSGQAKQTLSCTSWLVGPQECQDCCNSRDAASACPVMPMLVPQQAYLRHASLETSSSCPFWVMVLWRVLERCSVTAAEALTGPLESLQAPLRDSVPHAPASARDGRSRQGVTFQEWKVIGCGLPGMERDTACSPFVVAQRSRTNGSSAG